MAVLEYLISNGAAVNVQNNGGETPLIAAARRGQTLAIDALLEAGADRTLVNKDGQTALDIAQQTGNAYVVDVLLGNPRHR